MELNKHKKMTAALAVILCLPLVLIVWYSVQLMTGASEFKGISEVQLRLPDGSSMTFTESADVDFYTGILQRATALGNGSAGPDEANAVTLQLDRSTYRLYPSLELSGCRVVTPEGYQRLLSVEDASALVVRSEMEYLYASRRLPTLTVRSGETKYPVLPGEYVWNYRKADGVSYADKLTQTTDTAITCNLFADFENELVFSVQPSRYSMTVHAMVNGQPSYELPATSLSGLHFTQDTMVSIEIVARWSQAANAEQYGEATYRFLALYDVPAQVEAMGAGEDGTVTVQAGGLVLLRALYTNENEDLSVRADFQTDNLRFYYDAVSQSSYAALPVSAEIAAGSYSISVTSGETVKTIPVQVTPGSTDGSLSLGVDDETYAAWVSAEKRAELERSLQALRAASDGTPRWNPDLVFGAPVEGTPVYAYGASILLGNEHANESGLLKLTGDIYHVAAGTQVLAVQGGVCVFAGELGAGGNTVVIDHGCGVFSYYYHLASLSVAAGDAVSRSGALGMAGTSGYVGKQTTPVLHVAVSVGELYVKVK